VVGDIATSVDVMHNNAAGSKLIFRREQMVVISTLPDGIDVLVLCVQEKISNQAVVAKVKELLLKFPCLAVPRPADIGNCQLHHVSSNDELCFLFR
jgi:hypothetical protein